MEKILFAELDDKRNYPHYSHPLAVFTFSFFVLAVLSLSLYPLATAWAPFSWVCFSFFFSNPAFSRLGLTHSASAEELISGISSFDKLRL